MLKTITVVEHVHVVDPHDSCSHWCGVDACFADCGALNCRVINENGLGCRDYPGDDRPLEV